jgi:hypothetical protein
MEMWDVENENEDEAKQAKIKSAIICGALPASFNTLH